MIPQEASGDLRDVRESRRFQGRFKEFQLVLGGIRLFSGPFRRTRGISNVVQNAFGSVSRGLRGV